MWFVKFVIYLSVLLLYLQSVEAQLAWSPIQVDSESKYFLAGSVHCNCMFK